MHPVLFMPERSESRYALLGAFYAQVAGAARRLGLEVNPEPARLVELVQSRAAGGVQGAGVVPILLFFNHIGNPAAVRDWASTTLHADASLAGLAPPAAVQWIVDHPLQMHMGLTEQFAAPAPAGFGNRFCLSMVADDDLHLVKLRFPSVPTLRLWHGVDESALCDASSIEASHARDNARDIDVLMPGSIASEDELAALRAQVPQPLHKACAEMIRLRQRVPWMSFGQAYDAAMPASLSCSDQWGLMGLVFKYVTACVNRDRRLAMLAALGETSARNVVVIGGPAWKDALPHGSRARYAGEARYEDLPAWMSRTKVALCANPTQFTHAFSERLLLALAGGAAAVSDDRLWVRHEFAPENAESGCVRTFPGEVTPALGECVQRLLAAPAERAALATAARACVQQRHLWTHRVSALLQGLGLAQSARA